MCAADRNRLAGCGLLDVPYDVLVLNALRIPPGTRLLRLAPVCTKLRNAAYAAITAVTVAEPADLTHLSHVDTVTIRAPLRDFSWLQPCGGTH